jgi:hypothetical protein
MYQTIVSDEVWHGEIKNRAKTELSYWVYTTIARILNSEGKTRPYLAIHAQTSEGILLLLPVSRFYSVTYSRAASRALGRHLSEAGESKSSSHFESTRNSSLTIFVGKDYAA